jgi:predicted metalloprotease with PDZ domain
LREFARNVEALEVRGPSGRRVPAERIDKSGWRFALARAGVVEVRYRVYAHELSVQTSHLDASHGYLNGTSVFLYPEERLNEACELRIEPPRGWRIDTGLPNAPTGAGKRVAASARWGRGGRGETFRAESYDHLVDCPIEIGTHARVEFRVAGRRHRVAVWGKGNADLDAIARDLRKIVQAAAEVFGTLPYRDYLFIVHLSSGGREWGGLEHRNSTTLLCLRFGFTPAKAYDRFLSLAAHEFFHTWNVKRLKPQAFVPYDFQEENYTRLLWLMEGVTSYYDGLLLVRAGLRPAERYREEIADDWKKLQEQPGRFLESVEDSSLTTWVHFYRQDENYVNSGISYYLKGSLVGLALDLAIRERTRGRRSLDDVMRALWKRYGVDGRGMPEDALARSIQDATGANLRGFLNRFVAGTEDPPLSALLATVGWKLEPVYRGREKEGKPEKPEEFAGAGAFLGALTSVQAPGRLVVASVLRGGPGETMGLAPGDEVLAVDGFRVDEEGLRKRLAERAPGDRVALSVFRRDELLTLRGRLGPLPPDRWRLEPLKAMPATARRAQRRWLGKGADAGKRGVRRGRRQSRRSR